MPLTPLLRRLAETDRERLCDFVECGLELLDLLDGDPDLETNRVEDDFTPMPRDIDFGPGCEIADAGGFEADEDEPGPGKHYEPQGPGCVISDPGGCEHDGREPPQA